MKTSDTDVLQSNPGSSSNDTFPQSGWKTNLMWKWLIDLEYSAEDLNKDKDLQYMCHYIWQQHDSHVRQCSALQWQPKPLMQHHMNHNKWTRLVCRESLFVSCRPRHHNKKSFSSIDTTCSVSSSLPLSLPTSSASDCKCVAPSALIQPPSWTLRAGILRRSVTCSQQRYSSNERCCWK